MSQRTLRRTFFHVRPLQIAIIVLAVVTALIHLDRGLMMSLSAGPMGSPPAGASGGHPAGPPPGGNPPGGASFLSLLPLPVLFYLNFVGYIVLVTALYLPMLQRYQSIIRWVLIAFTAVTILAWFLISNASFNLLAYGDKLIELALIILLLLEGRQTRTARG